MKSIFAMLVLSAFTISQSRADQALDQLLACRRMPDSAARLECFDHAADAALTAKQPGAAPSSSSSSSSSSAAPASAPKPSTFESSIVRIAQPASGRATFTLENGQVWRQMDDEDARSAKIGDHVVVSKTLFFTAYWLRSKVAAVGE